MSSDANAKVTDTGATPEALPADKYKALPAEVLAEVIWEGRRGGAPGCSNSDCRLYPYYGAAPHECFYKKGAEFKIGQSTMLPRDQWPPNFVLDVEPGEDPATITYPSACGTYYCPTCLTGMPADGALSRHDEDEAKHSGHSPNPSLKDTQP